MGPEHFYCYQWADSVLAEPWQSSSENCHTPGTGASHIYSRPQISLTYPHPSSQLPLPSSLITSTWIFITSSVDFSSVQFCLEHKSRVFVVPSLQPLYLVFCDSLLSSCVWVPSCQHYNTQFLRTTVMPVASCGLHWILPSCLAQFTTSHSTSSATPQYIPGNKVPQWMIWQITLFNWGPQLVVALSPRILLINPFLLRGGWSSWALELEKVTKRTIYRKDLLPNHDGKIPRSNPGMIAGS